MHRSRRANEIIWKTVVAAGAMLGTPACGGKGKGPTTPDQGAIEMKPMPTEVEAPVAGTVADPATAEAMVVIETEPAGATITIDGKEVGVSPLTLTLPVGAPVEVQATLDGYLDKSTTVTPDPGRQTIVQYTLAAKERPRATSSRPIGRGFVLA